MYPSYLLLAYSLSISHLIHASPLQLQARSDIEDCLTTNNVPYAVQNSANWTALSTPYNLRLVYTPAVITIPETPDHVSSSVTCAAAAGLKVQAKGGGHSYASYSSGGQDGSLIIEMENFSSIEVDQSEYFILVQKSKKMQQLTKFQLPSSPRLGPVKDLEMLPKLFIAKASEHSPMALVLVLGLQDMLCTVVTATLRENGVSH